MNKQQIIGFVAAATLMAGAQTTYAGSIDVESQFAAMPAADAQSLFNGLSGSLANMVTYRSVKSPRPSGGLIGVDANLDITMIDLEPVNDVLNDIAAKSGMAVSSIEGSIPLPKLHAHLAIPFGLGASLYSLPEVEGMSASGYELSYAIIDGDIGFIASATYTLSAAYNSSTMTVNDVMEVAATGVEIRAAMGFDLPLLEANVYAGVGSVDYESTNLMSTVTLSGYSTSESKTTIGAEVKLGVFNLGMESDTIGSISTQSYKLGVGFGF